MTRARPRALLPLALAAAAACATPPPPSTRVRVALPATALPAGTTTVRVAVLAADMAPIAAILPLDGSFLTLEVPAGRDRTFTAEAFAGALRTHAGSTTVAELLAGQLATVSIRLLPVGSQDTTPPTVLSVSPAPGAAGAPVAALVTADFSEPLDPASVSGLTFLLSGAGVGPVAGTVTLSASSTTATFAPLLPLSRSVEYTATLGVGIADLAGNPLAAPFAWRFTTAPSPDTSPPRIVAVTPPLDYATRWIYVPADTAIDVTFSEPMDPATLDPTTFLLRDAFLGAVPASVSYSGLTATLTPLAPLTPFTWYQASVTTGARDQAGNALDVSGWPSVSGSDATWAIAAAAPPLQGAPPSPPQSVAAGGTHTLARLDSGATYAWGTNNGGALGTGQAPGAFQPTPARIAGFEFTAVQARSWTSEAVCCGGTPIVWGWGPSIGLATLDNPSPVSLTGSAGPVIALSAGYAHSLALLSTGPVWGFGDEGSGRLGAPLGTSGPRAISGLLDFRGVAAGGAHSLALRLDGTVLAWGDNTYGQLGDGTTTGRADPRLVSGLGDVAFISAGDGFSLAVRYDRSVWAWGRNVEGQLGVGTSADSSFPVQVTVLPPTVTSVSAGARHVLALLQDGTVRAWGHNAGGKLGDGTTTDRSLPVAVSGLTTVAEVSAGEFHSAARLADGTFWTWGGNSLGQLGDGTTADSFVPLLVPLDATPPTLLSTRPAAAAFGAPTGTPIVATFSEPIDPATAVVPLNFSVGDASGMPVPGTLSVAGAVVSFTPSAPLSAGTTYWVDLWGLADLAGNSMQAFSWSFTTGLPPAWSASTPLRQAYFSGVDLPQVGSLGNLDFLVWNDAGTLRGAGTTYPPIAGLNLPLVGRPVLLTGPNLLQGFIVYLEDAGGCPLGSRLRAIAIAMGSEGQEIPRSAPFTLHQAAAGCYSGFSAGHLGDGIAFAVVESGLLSAGTVSVAYSPVAGGWGVGTPTSGLLSVDPACAGSAYLVAEGLFGFAQAHAPGSPGTRAVLAVATRPDAATPSTVCAATLDAAGAWSLVSPLWTAGSAVPSLPEVTAALDGSGNAVVLASRAGATSAIFEMTAGYRADGGAGWEVTALDSSGRAALASAAFDAGGNVVAAWRPGPAAGATQIYAARRGAVTGWGAPARVSSGSGDTRFPRVSVLAGGDALALFQSDASGQFRVYASDYQAGAWSAPALVQDSALEGRFAETVRCPVGTTFVGRLYAWRETNPANALQYRIAIATREQ